MACQLCTLQYLPLRVETAEMEHASQGGHTTWVYSPKEGVEYPT